MKKHVLLYDNDLPEARALCRFRSIFALRTGIYSPVERLRKEKKASAVFYYHPDPFYEKCICEIEGLFSFREVYGEQEPSSESRGKFQSILYSKEAASPLSLLPKVGRSIEKDLSFWAKKGKNRNPAKLPSSIELIGPNDAFFIHKKSDILPGVVLDARDGPVVIDKGACISPFSYLKGPLYVGKGARLDNVRLSDSIVGREARLGGEIENSLIQDFSNKHHDGFLGHSLVGRWTNFGAMSTTSDLKNNYGEVRLQVPKNRLPFANGESAGALELQNISTGTIKFGSIVGDCVKIAIGCMLNTGSVLDAASNVFALPPPKYLPPLSWGNPEQPYKTERFWEDTKKIFARRRQSPPTAMRALLEELR